ncbi:50S ribosomal protein L5 [Nanoarchaeota archaeon]
MSEAKNNNRMREIRIEKLTLNIGAGKDQGKLEKGIKLIKNITGLDPVKTVTVKRIPTWGLRPGLPVGCKLTLRGEKALLLIPRLLDAKVFTLADSNFSTAGTVSFGIPEYIDIKDAKYDPDVGIIGLEVSITLERPGYRVKRRALKNSKLSKKHLITKEEAINFMKSKFNIKIGGEEE